MKSNIGTINSWQRENSQYLWVILACAAVLFITTIALRLVDSQKATIYIEDMVYTLSVIFIPLIAVNIIYMLKRFFLKYCGSHTQILMLKVIGLFVGVAIGTVIFEVLYASLGIVDDDYVVLGGYTFSTSASEVITNLFFAVILGLPIFFKQQVSEKAARAIEKKEQQLHKANALNTQSKLEALQARVNPHFLYNSLNSIASLIHINPDQAEQMVLSLSELFRYTLNQDSGRLSTIAEEAKMVETYLGIEQIRFGDNLKCEINIDESLHNIQIPKFLLQPIVENAIKHGTSKVTKGHIRLEISRNTKDLVFSISDNGPAFPEEFTTGYGLKSVSDQLNLLYKDEHVFELLNEPEKMVKIVLKNIS